MKKHYTANNPKALTDYCSFSGEKHTWNHSNNGFDYVCVCGCTLAR